MNCQHCGVEIPPTFTAALKTNVCPACSKEIMSSEMQSLIEGLSEEMEKNKDPQAVACWLVSNYKMVKIGEYTMPEGKKVAKPMGPISAGQQVAAENKVNEFFERAGIKKIPTRNDLPSPVKYMEVSLDEEEREVAINEQMAARTGEGLSAADKAKIAAQVESAFETVGSLEDNPLIKKQQIKQMMAQNALLGGSPKKGGFCRSS